MNISTFNDDFFELEAFADRLEKFIDVEHNYVDGSLVIGLNSRFGTGKSTFLRMWKNRLDSSGSLESKYFVVTVNAWESDYYGDPLFAIISALIESVESKSGSAEMLRSAAKDMGWFVTAIGGQIVNKVTGINIVEAGELAEKKSQKREGKKELMPDSFSVFEGRRKAMTALKTAIESVVEDGKIQILILVDELDRCRPDYAISYLETIKHIFDIKGVVFLLAADRKQLECSARMAFGSELDFDEYYRKFVHREILLPSITDSGYEKLAKEYVGFYLENLQDRNCFMKLDAGGVGRITELAKALKLAPRQIQEAFRILGHLFQTVEEKKGQLLWCVGIASILMVLLKVGKPVIFNALGNQAMKPQEAYDFFKGIVKENAEFWFVLCLTGSGLSTKNVTERLDEIIAQVGISEDMHLSSWFSGWGLLSRNNRFLEIYKKIEELFIIYK